LVRQIARHFLAQFFRAGQGISGLRQELLKSVHRIVAASRLQERIVRRAEG
jgi:hypothetical protein